MHRLLLLLAATALLAAGEATPAPAPRPAPPTVGLLDLSAVLNGVHLVPNSMIDLTKEVAEVNNKLKDLEARIKQTESDMAVFPREDERYGEFANRIEVLRTEYKLSGQRQRARLDAREAEVFKAVYAELRKLLGEFCSARQIDVVLQIPAYKPAARRMGDLMQELGTHTVLLADGRLELTKDFIAYVNTKHPLRPDAPKPPATGAAAPSAPALDLPAGGN